MRLLGFKRVELKPGESSNVKITADLRLLARFDVRRSTGAPANGTSPEAYSGSRWAKPPPISS
jgi:Fibronectin type III-like domain